MASGSQALKRTFVQIVVMDNGCMCCTIRGDLLSGCALFSAQGRCARIQLKNGWCRERLRPARALAV